MRREDGVFRCLGYGVSVLMCSALLAWNPGEVHGQTSSPVDDGEGEAARAEPAGTAALAAARPVLANPVEITRLLDRAYRSLDARGAVGEGTVDLLLRVEPDGSVSAVYVMEPVSGHPFLSAVARTVAGEMIFVLESLGDGAEGPLASYPYWVRQRVSFQR